MLAKSNDMVTIAADDVIDKFGIGYFHELSTFGALSDETILELLRGGTIIQLKKGEYIARFNEEASEFQVVLSGKLAYYKRYEGHDVLTRFFCRGEQVGFDLMIGLLDSDGTDVAVEDSLLLNISSQQFYDLHVDYPAEFGILMVNLARELAREIEMLEDVIGRGTGWEAESEAGVG